MRRERRDAPSCQDPRQKEAEMENIDLWPSVGDEDCLSRRCLRLLHGRFTSFLRLCLRDGTL